MERRVCPRSLLERVSGAQQKQERSRTERHHGWKRNVFSLLPGPWGDAVASVNFPPCPHPQPLDPRMDTPTLRTKLLHAVALDTRLGFRSQPGPSQLCDLEQVPSPLCALVSSSVPPPTSWSCREDLMSLKCLERVVMYTNHSINDSLYGCCYYRDYSLCCKESRRHIGWGQGVGNGISGSLLLDHTWGSRCCLMPAGG